MGRDVPASRTPGLLRSFAFCWNRGVWSQLYRLQHILMLKCWVGLTTAPPRGRGSGSTMTSPGRDANAATGEWGRRKGGRSADVYYLCSRPFHPVKGAGGSLCASQRGSSAARLAGWTPFSPERKLTGVTVDEHDG